VIDFMDEYGLSRVDFFDSMAEFKFSNDVDSYSKIPSKTKSAFTRM
jgi:hypothetical protein